MTESASAGRLSVEVVSDTSGFRRDLKTKLDAELRGVRAQIRAELDTSGLRAEADRAAADASRRATVQAKVDFDRAQIRRELATKLAQAAREIKATVTVEVKADTGRAREEVDRFRTEQEHRPVNVPVKTDTSSLVSLGKQLDDVGSKLISISRVTGLISGIGAAAGGLANVAGGLFSIAAAATQAVGVLAALPGLLSAGLQGAGALVLGFSGISGAVKALTTAHQQAGPAATKSASTQVNAAGQIKSAEQALANARYTGAQQVRSAEDNLTQAIQAQKDAQVALTAAYAQAREELQQLGFDAADAALAERQAEIDLVKAKAALDAANASTTTTPLAKQQAQLDYDTAVQRLTEAKDKAADSAKANTDAQKKGVAGSATVVSARKQEQQAAVAVKKAEQSLADSRRSAAQSIAQAQQALAAAHRSAATAAGGQAASTFALANAMDKLSPAGQRFAQFIVGTLIPRFRTLRNAVQEALLPPLQRGITAALPLLDVIQVRMVKAGAIIGGLAERLGKMAGSAAFKRDTATVMDANNVAIGHFGNAALYLADALRNVMTVAAPMVVQFSKLVERWAKSADQATTTGRATGRMAAFFDRASKTAGTLVGILRDLALGVFNIGRAATPAGNTMLTSLADAADRFRKATADPANQAKFRKFFADTIPMMRQFGDLFNRLVLLLVKFGQATGGHTFDGLFAVLNAAVALLAALASAPGGGTVIQSLLLLSGAGIGLGLVAKGVGGILTNIQKLSKLTGVTKIFGALTALPEGAEGGFGARAKAAGGRIAGGAKTAGRGAMAGLNAVGAAANAAADFLYQGARKAAGAIVTGVQAAGRGLLAAARGAGSLLSSAGRAVASGAATAARGAAAGGRVVGRVAVSGAQAAAAGLAATGRAAATAARSVAAFTVSMARAGAAAAVSGLRAAGSAIASTATAAARGAIALGALAAAHLRAAAAAALSTARTILFNTWQLIVKAATLAWAAAQALLDAAMDANPIGLIVLAIAALVAGVIIAYKKVGWFRDGVNAVFGFLKTAVVFAINFVKDHWQLILAVILGPLGILIGLVIKYWKQIYGAISSAVSTVVNFVKDHWRLLLIIIGGPLGLLVVLVIRYWKQIYGAVSGAVSAVVSFVRQHWQLLLAIVLGPLGLLIGLVIKYWHQIYTAISTAVTTVVGFVRQHWQLLIAIIGGPLGVIIGLVVKHWNQVKSVTSALISSILGKIRDGWNAIRSTFTNALSAIYNLLVSRWNQLKSITNSLASVLRSTISNLMSAMRNAFSNGVSAIGSAWNRLRDVTKAPVNFLIGTVYDNGIRGLWNTVMGWLHISGMSLGYINQLASGGTLADPAPAVPMVTNGAMAIVGEGNPSWPEYVIPTDPKYRGRAAALWAAAGGKLQMLAGGGILGGILDGIKSAAKKVLSVGQLGLDLIANPGAIWDKLAGPILSNVGGFASSAWGQAIEAIPKKLMGTIKDAALAVVASFKAGFGGDGQKAVQAARSQIGLPYTWGGGGPSGPSRGFAQGAGTVGFDCSSLMEYAWYQAAHKDITRTTGSQRGFMKTISSPRPGAVGQPHPGHTYMYSGNGHIVEAAHTGTNIRETTVRGGEWWGWPPWLAAGGTLLGQLGERFLKYGGPESMFAKVLGVAGDPGGVLPKFGPVGVSRFDSGGILTPGLHLVLNGLRDVEAVLNPSAVTLLGGARGVTALNAAAGTVNRAAPRAATAPAGTGAHVNVYPQPRQSEYEIGVIAARKLGAMLT